MNMDKRPVDGICIDCKYYYDEEIPDTVGCGECRYGPPTAMPIFGKGDYHAEAFPLVSEYDWCWKFEKKPHYEADKIMTWCMVSIIAMTEHGKYPNGKNDCERGHIERCKVLIDRIKKDIKGK